MGRAETITNPILMTAPLKLSLRRANEPNWFFRGGPIAFGISLVLLGSLAIGAAEPSTISFSLDFPNSSPEHYSISAESDGRGHYESSGKFRPTPTIAIPIRPTSISQRRRAPVSSIWLRKLTIFPARSTPATKSWPSLAPRNLCIKTASDTSSGSYNFSPVPAVQQLTALFQSVGATLEFGHRLTYFRRYQKLALDDELKRMEDQARRGELMELQAVKPVLQEIYDDPGVMNVVRARARRIVEMDHSPPPAGNVG